MPSSASPLLTYVFRNVDKRMMLIIAIIVACFAGYAVDIGDKFSLMRIINFYPFYLAGTMVNRESVEKLAKKKGLKILGAVIIIAWIAACFISVKDIYFLRTLMTGKNPYSVLKPFMQPFGGLYRLLCYAVSALLCFAVICVSSTRKLPLITKIGSKTLQIYFWHAPILFVILPLPFIQNMIEGDLLSQWLFALLGIPLSFILALKPFEFPCSLIMKYSKVKDIIKKDE